MYNLHLRKPHPLLERDAIFEVPERLGAGGDVVEAIDEDALCTAAEGLSGAGFNSVAVCFLHSYVNSVHEERAQQVLESLLPDVPVVRSSQVAPEWREYERTSTTVVAAYITPIMRNYLGELEQELGQRGLRVPVYITESNGGVMAAHMARDHAVATLFSGPVGGVAGAYTLSGVLDEPHIISADVGGTSFDVSLIREGRPALQPEFYMAGLPVLAPAIEVHTVGAGGGSIISVDPTGRLRVGPESAGANPGPACYGRGGTAPTVTDAHVVLGHLPAQHHLAGDIALDVAAARDAMARAGEVLELSPEMLAEQALEIVNFRMAEAIRELTVERGVDPGLFTLCAFGGAGGLHAAALADELEIARIVVPSLPGSFSAWGMLQSGIRHDVVRSFFCPAKTAVEKLGPAIANASAEVSALLQAEGLGEEQFSIEVSADLRYQGQEYSMTIRVATPPRLEEIISSFHTAYQRRYGHSNLSEEVEFVAIRVTGLAEFSSKPAPQPILADGKDPVGATNLLVDGKLTPAPIWRREDLGRVVDGPCLVLEYTATTVVPGQWQARLVEGGHLLLERSGGGR